MSNPQQPEQRRSDKGGATSQDSAELKAAQPGGAGPGASRRGHGMDKGKKGGGRGGATSQDSAELKAAQPGGAGPGASRRGHGMDKGKKGGGRGGATPPEQQPDHP